MENIFQNKILKIILRAKNLFLFLIFALTGFANATFATEIFQNPILWNSPPPGMSLTTPA